MRAVTVGRETRGQSEARFPAGNEIQNATGCDPAQAAGKYPVATQCRLCLSRPTVLRQGTRGVARRVNWRFTTLPRRPKTAMNPRRFVASILTLVMAGCATMAGLAEAPSVTVAGLELVDATLLEQRFAVKLRVMNPNDVDLPIRGVSFTLDINGHEFARGVGAREVTVPRYGEALLELNAVSSLSGILRQLDEARRGERTRLTYRIRGRLDGAGIGGLPFDRSGELSLGLSGDGGKTGSSPPPAR